MTKTFFRLIGASSLLAFLTSFASLAFAHHPSGGAVPTTFIDGLLSGIGHPIIGADHFAFIIAAGTIACLVGSRFLLPLAFIGATIFGTILHINSVGLPVVELMIALSLAVIGFVLFLGKHLSTPVLAVLFLAAGVFHGHAYGEAVFGAESTPIGAYLIGFSLVQYAVAVIGGTIIASMLGKAQAWQYNMPARIAGGMVAGVGMLLLSEHALNAVGWA